MANANVSVSADADLESGNQQENEPINGDNDDNKPALANHDSEKDGAEAAAAIAPTDTSDIQMSSDNLNKGASSDSNVADGQSDTKISKAITPPDAAAFDKEDELSRAMFANEGQAALIWISFTAFYWTLSVWIVAAVTGSFINAAFGGWCAGFVAMMVCGYTYKQGAWPSGATRDNPKATNGIGRYTAFGLTACVCIDFLILSFESIKDGTDAGSVIRGSCHFFSLIFATMFFFKKFYTVNPDIASTAFFGEWLDIGFTIIVLFVLHNALDSDSDSDPNCFNESICIVYYISFIFQLVGWLFPMMLLEGWGTGKDGIGVSRHLFILDILTDVPIIMAVLIEDAYKDHVIIFIDVMWKVILTIRSLGYYMVYELWLRKGERVFKRNFLDRQRGETLK